jgi:hypothetical protein
LIRGPDLSMAIVEMLNARSQTKIEEPDDDEDGD